MDNMMLIDLETAPVSSLLLLALALALALWTVADMVRGVSDLRASRARGRELDVMLSRLDAEIDGHAAGRDVRKAGLTPATDRPEE